MKLKKSKKKELRRKYENLVGEEYVKQIKKQPVVSLTEWVDLMKRYKKYKLDPTKFLNPTKSYP